MVSSVPPVSSSTASAPVQGSGTTGDSVEAEVTNLPPSLESTDRAVTLRGEVQSVNDDGTTTISTPRGPVDVKLPDPQPTAGQRVEVTVQAGSPPTDANVRIQPQQPTPQTPLPQTSTPAQTPSVPQEEPPAVQVTLGQPSQAQTPAASGNSASLPAIPLLQEEGQQVLPQQPVTAQTQGPVPTPGQQEAEQIANPPQAQTQSQVSPQSLLNFLKAQLQTVMQAPNNGAVTQTGNPAPAQQRPLQVGQLVRLIPTPGQAVTLMPAQTATGLTAAPGAQVLPRLAGELKLVQVPGTPAGLQTTGMPQQEPLAQMAQQNTPILRALQPFLNMQASPTTAMPNGPTVNVSVTPEISLAGLMRDLNAAEIQPHVPNGIAGPLVQLPQMHAPIVDARLAATTPVIQPLAAQNPGTATLLHGSPSTPVLFGQIAGETEQGLPIIRMPMFSGDDQPKMVTMTLQYPARTLSIGTWVRMDVMQTALSSSAANFSTQPMAQAQEWGALDDLIDNLRAQPQTQGTAVLLQNAVPKPGATGFSAPVLMYLAAARSGDITAWLGERVTDPIRNMRRADLLAKITGALSAANTRAREDTPAAPGEWRNLTLPMLAHDQHIHQIMLHYRSFERDSEGAQAGKKQTGSRFVLDLSLSRIGPMQVDGLSVGRQLDVVLRSEQSFSPAMRETLRARYTDALNGIGFSGQLNFKADGDHRGWVDFKEDTPHAVARA